MKGNGLKRYRLRFNQHYRLWLAGGLLFFCACAWGQPSPVGGTLGAVGSDTMAGLMLRWGEALHHRYPDITLQFQASGSASAPTALVRAQRALGRCGDDGNERQQFIDVFAPHELSVAQDALLLVVHRHNPGIANRKQADAITT